MRDATSITAEEALDHGDDRPDRALGDPAARRPERDDGARSPTAPSSTLDTTDWALVDESMGGFVGFLHALLDPNLAFIFFWLGLVLIVIELIVPGHIFSGTIGTILLILAIVSFGLLPVRLIGVILLIAAAVAFFVRAERPRARDLGRDRRWSACVLGGVVPVRPRRRRRGVAARDRRRGAGRRRRSSGWSSSQGCSRSAHMPPVARRARRSSGARASRSAADLHPDGIVRVASEEWQAVAPGARSRRATTSASPRSTGWCSPSNPSTDEHEPAADAGAEGRNHRMNPAPDRRRGRR